MNIYYIIRKHNNTFFHFNTHFYMMIYYDKGRFKGIITLLIFGESSTKKKKKVNLRFNYYE